MNPRLLQGLAVGAVLLYPFAIYLLAGRIPAGNLGAILLLLIAARLAAGALTHPASRRLLRVLAVAATLGALAVLVFPVLELRQIRLYPALISFGFFVLFFGSLFSQRPLVERIARAMEGELPPPAIHYTRRVTQIWAAILLANSAIALSTAVWGSLATWTLYNGLLSYLVLAAVFGIEFVVRHQLKRRWEQV